MKKFLTLRVPTLLAIFVIVLTLGLISMKVGALIGDYWDIGPWRVSSSGDLISTGGGFVVVISSTSTTYTAPAVTGTIVVRDDNWKVYICTTTVGPCWVVVGGQT